ncbi:hypothetical protein LIER_01321 [Lithospermum erythrorhizon]|uniref:Reverse transcriptase domain-containing protein n=1 Tax=Lithospermum erythrorhizon TaxID=34254 RepID=A0AAV3NKH1_LITER
MTRQKGWSIKNLTKGLENTSKPPLCLLVNRPIDKHKQNKPETGQELLVIHSHPMGAVMWKYPTKTVVESVSPPIEQIVEQNHSLHITIEEGEPLPEDAINAPLGLKEEVKITIDELKEVNLGTDDEPRSTYISALLSSKEEMEYVACLKEFIDAFAWTYKEMRGLDLKVAVHHLAVKENIKPGKQAHRRSSGYNQIRIDLENEELIVFQTPKRVYCDKVVPFGLMNAEATYQRAMEKVLDDMLHKNVEC